METGTRPFVPLKFHLNEHEEFGSQSGDTNLDGMLPTTQLAGLISGQSLNEVLMDLHNNSIGRNAGSSGSAVDPLDLAWRKI